MRTLKDIPGPKAWPVLGHIYLFLPIIGNYSASKFSEAIQDMMRRYGPIIKLKLNGPDVVITSNADDTRTMFQNEGKYPMRPILKAFKMVRETHNFGHGVITGDGKYWHTQRQGVQPLLKKPLLMKFEEKHTEIAKHHIGKLKTELDKCKNGIVEDILTHMLKFTLDAITVISPVMKLSDENDKLKTLEKHCEQMDSLFVTLSQPPIWGLYKTKAYKSLEQCTTYFYNKIYENMKNINIEEQPYLKTLFDMKELTHTEKVGIAMDIFLGGIDASATTLAMTLHYLSQNRALQDEIVLQLKQPDHQFRLLKACIKETLRMSPTAGANSRCLMNDTELSGYLVPKGTFVYAMTTITGTSEKYFDNSAVYKPERWLRDSKDREKIHPFASLPFGHGARMCPGKLIVEQEIVLFLSEIVKNFVLESIDDSELGMVFRMNRVPERKINLKFIKR